MSALAYPVPQMPPPPPGYDSWRFGPAFLRPAKERDHFELMRPVFVVRNEGDRTIKETYPEPFGPIAVYRTKRRGDKIDLSQQSLIGPSLEVRSADANGQPISLILVWWPGMDKQ